MVLIIKTTESRVPDLVTRLRDMHSYDVPEIVVLQVESGLPEYLSWVQREVRE